jgi:RNA methyltransferase, TrmH family
LSNLLCARRRPITSNLQSTIRDLQRRKARERRGLALLEGVRLVEEALGATVPLRGVVAADDLDRTPRGAALLQSLARHAVPVETVPAHSLDKLAETDTPQGVVAVAEPRRWTENDIALGERAAVLVLDGIQDPGNLGALVRTAFALGAAGVIALKGTVDWTNPKALRGAMGASFRLPVVPLEDEQFAGWATRQHCALWAAAADGQPFDRVGPVPERVALLVGNEGAGVRAELANLGPRRVGIPLTRGAESLNVAVAAGILLHEVLRAR